MTGGLAYVARDESLESLCHTDFVRLAAPGNEEEMWLRRVLREHARLTGSPVVRDLLRSRRSLPLVRIEPVRLPCPVEQTWISAAARFMRRGLALASAAVTAPVPPPPRELPLEAVS